MKNKVSKIISLILVISLALGLVACGAKEESKKLKLGATVTPHGEILAEAKKILADQGIDLEIVEFNEYTLINPALANGEIDANYFQHGQYLADYNQQNGTELVSAGLIHYEPYGLYGGKLKSLDEIKQGSQIAVPNDASNEARALLLLEQVGLIKLKPGAGIKATILDIEENPHNLEIVELAAEQIPRSLQDLDFAVINGNYAIAAGLNVAKDALAIEAGQGELAANYANLIAVKAERVEDELIQALVQVLQSDQIHEFIESKYEGAVKPIN